MNTIQFNDHKIAVSIRSISPVQACSILDRSNIHNRKISKDRVNQYARDMKNGNWSFNGDVIRFDCDGALIDGQHRLTAVAKSGIHCEFLIVSGIETATKHTIDAGKSRTGGDALAIQAGVSFLESHMINKAITAFEKYKRSGFGTTSGAIRLTNQEALASYYENKPLIDKAINFMKSNIPAKGVLMPKGDTLFLAMMFIEIDEQMAHDFLVKILTGAGVDVGDVELHLRNVILESKMGSRKLNQKATINSAIKCWNSIRRGKPIKVKANCVWRPMTDKSPTAI